MKTTRPFFLVAAVSVLTGIGSHAQTVPPVQAIVHRASDAGMPTHKFSGTVADSAGNPIAGATVEYWRSGGNFAQPGELELETQTTSGSDGTYEFQVPRGLGFLLARKPGLAPAWQPLSQPFNSMRETASPLVLTPPGTLAGVVLDESNQPVANAEVSVEQAFSGVPPRNRSWSFNSLAGKPARDLFAVRTDAAGRFRIENFPTRISALFAVHAPGKVLRPLDLQPGDTETTGYLAGQGDIKLVVEPAGGIEGKISITNTNLPLPVARLTLQSDEPVSLMRIEPEPVQSGADGRFRFEDVPAGSYRLQANFGANASSEWVAEAAPVSVASGQVVRGVQVTVQRGALLEVSVVGKADRKPLAKINVVAYGRGFHSAATSDSNGIARMYLLPGDYDVTAFREFLSSPQTSAAVEAGMSNQVEIEIAAPKKISGVVRAPDGQPAAGVPVQLVSGFFAQDTAFKCDANGKFELDSNPTGFVGNDNPTACVLARDPEHNLAAVQDLDENTTNLELKLAPGLTLAGRVESGGKPLTNPIVQVAFQASRRNSVRLEALVSSNPPGHYEISALPAGRNYTLLVAAPGYGPKQLPDLDISADPGRQELDPVQLLPANLQIAGQVLDADGQPAAGCGVQLNGDGQQNANTRSGRDGRFVFAHVCAGSVQLSANGPGAFGNLSADGGDTNVVLRLRQNYSYADSVQELKLTGLVTDAEGNPDPGAQVAVFPGYDAPRWVKTGPGGQYHLTWSLEPLAQNGGTRLVVRDLARNLAAVEELPEDTTNLDVKLKPALTLTGQVKNAADAPAPGASVGLWFPTGSIYNQWDKRLPPADVQGRYEFKCLPADGSFIVFASAKGYGKSQQPVVNDADTTRLELSPLVLQPADQVIAGQVLKDDDQPAARVEVSLRGAGQPEDNLTTTTDSQGRFHFQVCAGSVQISANARGSYGNLSTARRAPKVTVTRKGDSLCHKGCYPMAFVFGLFVLCASSIARLSSRRRTPSCPVAVERSREARQRLSAERNRHRARLPWGARGIVVFIRLGTG